MSSCKRSWLFNYTFSYLTCGEDKQNAKLLTHQKNNNNEVSTVFWCNVKTLWFINGLFNPDIGKGKCILTMRKLGFFSKRKKIVFIFYRQVNHSQNVHVTITYGHSMTERKYVLFILSFVHFIVLASCEIKYIFITGTWRYIFFLIIKFIIPFIYILIIRKLYDVRCLWYSCMYAYFQQHD